MCHKNEQKSPCSFVVVTPNYNMGEHLEETIQSVLNNLGPEDEYFIVDGGSEDGSLDIIRRYEHHLSGWISEPDRGYADALAKGFARSDAPLMCWINSGDLLLEGSLDARRKAFEEEGVDFVFGDDYYIDEKGYILQHSSGAVGNLGHMMLYGAWTPLQDACAWRRSLYEACGGMDACLKHAADFDLFLRMTRIGSVCYLPMVLSAFRRHHGQISVSGASRYEEERLRIRTQALLDPVGSRPFRGLFHRFWYQGFVKVRSRVPLLNRRRSKRIGEHVSRVSVQRVA